jgi:hypothetical protein
MPPPAVVGGGIVALRELCRRYESGCPVAGRAQQPGQAVALPVGQRGQGIGHLFHPLVDVVVIVAGRGVVAAG